LDASYGKHSMSGARNHARASRSGRPIMVLLELLGRRMSLRILWELSQAEGRLTFRALTAAAETNPSVLNARLKDLRRADLVRHGRGGYELTQHGRALLKVFLPLYRWAGIWARREAPQRRPAAKRRRRS